MLFGGMLEGLQAGQQYQMNKMKMQEEGLRLDAMRQQQAQEQAFAKGAAPIVKGESDFLSQLAGRADANSSAVQWQEMQEQLKATSQLEALAYRTGNLDKAEDYGKRKADITEKMFATQKEQRLQKQEDMKYVASLTIPLFTEGMSLPEKQRYWAANRPDIVAHMSPEEAKSLPQVYDGKPETDAKIRGLSMQSVSSYQQQTLAQKQTEQKQKQQQFMLTYKQRYDLAQQRMALAQANFNRMVAKDQTHVSDERKGALRELAHRAEAQPTAQEVKDVKTALRERHPGLVDKDVDAAAEQTLKQASSFARDNFVDIVNDEDAPLYSRGEQIDQALDWMDQNGAYTKEDGYIGGLFGGGTTFTPPKTAAAPKAFKPGARTVERTRAVGATTATRGAAKASGTKENPVQVKSAADFNALPSGAYFLTPEGKLKVKP